MEHKPGMHDARPRERARILDQRLQWPFDHANAVGETPRFGVHPRQPTDTRVDVHSDPGGTFDCREDAENQLGGATTQINELLGGDLPDHSQHGRVEGLGSDPLRERGHEASVARMTLRRRRSAQIVPGVLDERPARGQSPKHIAREIQVVVELLGSGKTLPDRILDEEARGDVSVKQRPHLVGRQRKFSRQPVRVDGRLASQELDQPEPRSQLEKGDAPGQVGRIAEYGSLRGIGPPEDRFGVDQLGVALLYQDIGMIHG